MNQKSEINNFDQNFDLSECFQPIPVTPMSTPVPHSSSSAVSEGFNPPRFENFFNFSPQLGGQPLTSAQPYEDYFFSNDLTIDNSAEC